MNHLFALLHKMSPIVKTAAHHNHPFTQVPDIPQYKVYPPKCSVPPVDTYQHFAYQ